MGQIQALQCAGVSLRLRISGLALLSILLLAGLGCPESCRWGGSARPQGSLLLITVDTLRADRLASYGHRGARTPASDRLAREGTRFTTALTPLPRTTPSIATLLTGLAPPSHKVRGLFSSLPAEIPTLAGWLRARGWKTGAFTSNLFLRPGSGLGREFQDYSNPKSRWAGNSAAEITSEALAWLRSVGDEQPYFLWVHYLDPHWTYDPPAPYDTLFDPGFHGPWPYGQVAPGESEQGAIIFQNTMTPEEVRHAIALYDGEIASTETEVARLLDGIGAGRLDRTLVIYTSDHGESLGEHDYYFDHGEYLYDGTLRVPLLMRWPGHVPAGKVVTRMARLQDVAPTALALFGAPLPGGLDGRSLAGDLTGESDVAPRECFFESDHTFVRPQNPRHFVDGFEGKWRGIQIDDKRLLFIPHDARGEAGDLELYDLATDPGETHNLASERPDEARALRDRLRAWWAANGASRAGSDEPPPDLEILRSLGYAQ